ncbi:hypothetical protein [Nostoc sp. WHI]|uniref:hypothetical protein n=1 Tax=Nostoc sp. WHI TaxID=2650611 RepID=UPI0018C6F3E2|nr:hypothetical protein [Nostoc sp. WHI]
MNCPYLKIKVSGIVCVSPVEDTVGELNNSPKSVRRGVSINGTENRDKKIEFKD